MMEESWFQFQFVGDFPLCAQFLGFDLFFFPPSYFFTPGLRWCEGPQSFVKDAGSSTSWINQGPSTKKSSSLHAPSRTGALAVLFFSRFFYYYYFSAGCPVYARHQQSPSQNTGWIRIGLDLFLLFFPVGGSWLLDRSNRSIISLFLVNQSLSLSLTQGKRKSKNLPAHPPTRTRALLCTVYNSINPPHRIFIYTAVYRI